VHVDTATRLAFASGQLALVSEGYCPYGGRLELRDDRPYCGWCPECGYGWSADGDSVFVHPDTWDLLRD
jgi:hypothetical protein